MRVSLTALALMAVLAAALHGPPAAARPVPGPDDTAVLSNGLTLMIEGAGAAGSSELVQALLLVEAGEDRAERERLAHVVAEGLLASRSGPSGDSLRKELARLGVSVDTAVGDRVVTFRFTMPPASADGFTRLLASALAVQSVPASTWDEAVARQRRREERQSFDPWGQGTSLLQATLWERAGPRAGDGAGATQPESVAEAADALRRRLYVAPRMVLGISGLPGGLDSAAREALERIPAAPAGAPAERTRPAPPEPAALSASQVRCAVLSAASPPVLVMGQAVELDDDRDFYALQALTHVLGNGHFSRLHRRLRLEEGLAHTVAAEVIPVGRHRVTLRIGCQTENPAAARQVVLEELERLASEGVSASEAGIGTRLVQSRLLLDSESAVSRLRLRALSALSDEPVRTPADGREVLGELDPATLSEAARRLLDGGAPVAVVVSTRIHPLCRVDREAAPDSGSD